MMKYSENTVLAATATMPKLQRSQQPGMKVVAYAAMPNGKCTAE